MKSIFLTVTKQPTSTIGLIVVDLLYFTISDPLKLPDPFIIVGFLLMGASIYRLCRIGARLLVHSGLLKSSKRWVITAVSLFIFLIIALQAIGQLSLRDIAALVPLVIIAYFYFTRVARKSLNS